MADETTGQTRAVDWDAFERWVEDASVEQLRLLWHALVMAWASKHQGYDLRGQLASEDAA